MPEQRPTHTGAGPDGNSDASVRVENSTRTFGSEPEFQRAVEELADEYDWDRFHIPRRAYEEGIPYSGFPDLVLRYWDESGCTMVIAELKPDEDKYTPGEENLRREERQKQFLRDFAKHGIPTFLFRYRHWEYIKQMLKDGPPEATGEIIEPSLPIVRSRKLLSPCWDDNRTLRRFLQETFDFHHSGRGELAELRRMNPSEPNAAMFWRLMAMCGRLSCPDTESKWALILHGIALMTPNAHSATPVGRALFNGGDTQRKQAFYSDLRFNRLLTARGTMLRSLLSEMFRMMSSARQSFDWYEMASFILNENDEEQEKARTQIARDYYAAEYQANH